MKSKSSKKPAAKKSSAKRVAFGARAKASFGGGGGFTAPKPGR